MLNRDITKLVSIDDICNVSRGASPRPIKNYLTQSEEGVPWIKIGDVSPCDKYIKKTNERITQEGAKKSRLLHKGDLILSNSMSFGRPYILEIDGCIHDGWISLSGFENFVLRNFLYEVLNTKCVQDYWIMKANNGGAMSNLNSDIVKSTIIKIPSIKVQEEIVKILDSFTNLIDALNEELSLRQKQFEYYREKLLTFEDNHYSISRITMDDLFNFKNGYTPSTKNTEYWTNGEVNWFTVADFKKNNNVLYDSIKKVSISAVKGGKLFKPNSILLATTATIGIHALIRTAHISNQQLTNLSLKEKYVDKIDIKYIYYYMFLIDEWCKKNYHGGGFMIVDMVGLKKQQIPIPSLTIQQSIVEKLDAFESLISSLKEEIALR